LAAKGLPRCWRGKRRLPARYFAMSSWERCGEGSLFHIARFAESAPSCTFPRQRGQSMPDTQSYRSHARFDPPFHFFVFPVLLINAIVSIVIAVRTPDAYAVWSVVVAFALAGMALKMRLYALRNQDRLIRIEERLRMQSLLAEPLRARISELTIDQCIGLRFASDGELAGLVERALRENLNRKQIKQAVQTWRADHCRI
jgi:hypothetical protein